MFRSCRTCKPSNQPKNSPSLSLSLSFPALFVFFPHSPTPSIYTASLSKIYTLRKTHSRYKFSQPPDREDERGGKKGKVWNSNCNFRASYSNAQSRRKRQRERERERERERSPRWKNFRSIFRAESGWEGLRGAERDGKGEEDGGGSIRDPLTRNQKRYARKSDGPVWLENTWNISSILPAGRWECVWQP